MDLKAEYAIQSKHVVNFGDGFGNQIVWVTLEVQTFDNVIRAQEELNSLNERHPFGERRVVKRKISDWEPIEEDE